MTKLFKTVTVFSLVLMPFLGTACEDKETKDALTTCKNDLGNEQKKSVAELATINDLKSQLAQAQAKLAEASKPAEPATATKAESKENGKAESKGSGKTESKGKKSAKK